jgi:2-polyprenyl-3-methyl-5-hydroxy-6-metoxy-1,4-benzoquinol methylase
VAVDALSFYTDAPPVVRALVRARWAACPYDRVAEHVPERGRVLEVGCGYGVFSCHLAVTSRDREVLGIDTDVDKVVHGRFAARRAQARGARCDLHLAPPGEVPAGPWDSVVLVDVLSSLDPDAQQGILHSCAEQLALGGVLVVKTMATSPRWKARWARARQSLAVRLGGASEGARVLEPSLLGTWLDKTGLVVSHHPADQGYPQPHHVVVAARRRSVA